MMTQELMNKPRIKYSFYLGLLLVAFGILFNKWLIELFLVPDNKLESPTIIAAIGIVQLTVVVSGIYLVVKRPRTLPINKSGFLLLTLSFGFSFLIAEFAARRLIPPEFSYRQLISSSLELPVRLHQPNTNVTYDIRGFYEGASEIVFRTSANRFVMPDPGPVPSSDFKVLFLGGSTTESMYQKEDQRWVALLNQHDQLATYNAGNSGANTIDEYLTFLYLTEEEGMRFDLVVLSTMVNDRTWLYSLRKHDGVLRIERYRDHLATWYANEQPQSFVKELTERFRLFYVTFQVVSQVDRTVFSKSPETANVVALKRQKSAKALNTLTIPLAECPEIIEEDLMEYGENALSNLLVFRDAVSATGAKMLVVSEATTFGAPSSSFYEDFRTVPRCGSGRLSFEDSAVLLDALRGIYLDAAERAGAYTYDLALHLSHLTNGPEGGRYIYDSVHYTPAGSAELAKLLLQPILDIVSED